MKNLFVFALLILGLFSCTESKIIEEDREIEEVIELPEELQELLSDIQTRNDWPKPSYDVGEFLNHVNFTPDNYLGCESELITASYGPEEMEGADGVPLSSIIADALYNFSDLNAIMTEFWTRVNKECADDFVIVSAEFYSYYDQDEYLSHLGVDLEICCSPILGPKNPKDGPGPHTNEELGGN